jgi:hypothetical protein
MRRSVIVEVRKRGFVDWCVEWRQRDDAYYADNGDVSEYLDLFMTSALTRRRALRRARRILQDRINRQIRHLNRQALENTTFERVEIFLDVTKLREAERAAESN